MNNDTFNDIKNEVKDEIAMAMVNKRHPSYQDQEYIKNQERRIVDNDYYIKRTQRKSTTSSRQKINRKKFTPSKSGTITVALTIGVILASMPFVKEIAENTSIISYIHNSVEDNYKTTVHFPNGEFGFLHDKQAKNILENENPDFALYKEIDTINQTESTDHSQLEVQNYNQLFEYLNRFQVHYPDVEFKLDITDCNTIEEFLNKHNFSSIEHYEEYIRSLAKVEMLEENLNIGEDNDRKL